MAVVIGLPDSYYQWLQTFYASRRARMLGILDKHGFKYAVPEGAYYVMADFPGTVGLAVTTTCSVRPLVD